MAIREDHTFDLGEHWLIGITCHKDPAATQVMDISGSGDVALGVAGLVINKASGGVVVTDGPNGVAQITVSPTAQHGLVPGAYPYTIRATAADGTVLDQAYGIITIRATPEFPAP